VTVTPNASPFQYVGRENDGTGLYYCRARYYDPIRSRFIGEDPIGFRGGANFFAYVANDPLGGRDPLGLVIECIRRLMLVTAYSDTGPGSDWPYYKGGNPGSVGPGTVATANSGPNPNGPTRPATPYYPYGSRVKVYGGGGKTDYEDVIHDTGAGWDIAHHDVPPDEWIDIWLPKPKAKQWGVQWREVEICYEKPCP